MKNSEICHLHVHNEHSLLDGYGTAKQFVEKAKELKFTHLALTNHGNTDGLIQFQKECDKAGIKPISGCELYVVPKIMEKNKKEKKGHLTLLIKNQLGWKNLCALLTKANLDGFYYKPRIDYDMLLGCDLSGFVILTGCAQSFLNIEQGEAFLWGLSEKMKKDLYIEIMPHYFDEQIKHNERLPEFAMKYGLKMAATNDSHYINEEDAETQEVLLAIQTRSRWNDPNRWKFDITGFHLRTANEMKEAFRKQNTFPKKVYIKALRNTMEIAKKCEEFRIPNHYVSLPRVRKGENDDKKLWELCINSKVYKKLKHKKIYRKRLKTEFKTIKEKGFSRYFLIIDDLLRWCRKNDIMIGCGRGSVSGSLLACVLGITSKSIDPIKYGLLFDRFINKNRIDMPDIDLDFEDTQRFRIKEYLESKYGINRIAGVSTFLTMKGRAVIRDVARVFNVPLQEVDTFAKTIITNSESDSPLKESLSTPEGKAFKKKYPQVAKHALKLEGQKKSGGQHAAALVVSPKNLLESDRGNICVRNGQRVINWEMSELEHVGLMKLDALGLNTLTVLHEAKRLIEKNHNEIINFDNLKPNDKGVFREIAKGNTVGVFQLSTYIMTEMAKKMHISCFNDMVAALALVRPGPLDSGMTDDYIKRKNGYGWKKKHPVFEEITEETYGVIVYQEQIMKVFHKVAGLPYSTADEIRKVIGKKRHVSEFEPYRKQFLKGCLKVGVFSKQDVKWFWKMLLKCSRYVFNKSHACSYAMLAYWTAWTKYYYPREFITACLTYGGDSKKEEYVGEAKRLGLTISTPKIGISDAFKWKIKGNVIYMPFIEIKGVGEKTALECSQLGKQTGFFNTTSVPKGMVGDILIEINAYDKKAKAKNTSKYFSFEI